MLDIMCHRLIVLGTTVVFGDRLFDLSEFYIKSRRIFNIESPFEQLNKEMLIVGLCDKSPAFCLELVQMLKENKFHMLDIAYDSLGKENSLLINFLNLDSTEKPYTSTDINFLSMLTSLSPHIGMSIELKTLSTTKAMELKQEDHLLRTQKAKQNNFARIKQIHHLFQLNEDAQFLQNYIEELKFRVWQETDSSLPTLQYYKEVTANLSDLLEPIDPMTEKKLQAFENIFINGLTGESAFSNKLVEALNFLSDEFKNELTISANAATIDANNMIKLQSYYKNLQQHQKIQLMHELLFPLICQLGEFVSHELTHRKQMIKTDKTNCYKHTSFFKQENVSPTHKGITPYRESGRQPF